MPAPSPGILRSMRAVPLPFAVLIGLAIGAVGWFLGRASVDPVVEIVEAGPRGEAAPPPRPLLESGRGGPPHSSGPERSTQAPVPAEPGGPGTGAGNRYEEITKSRLTAPVEGFTAFGPVDGARVATRTPEPPAVA